MVNFKIKKTDRHFNYGLGTSLFYSHIEQDLKNTVGCFGSMPHHILVKLNTIHSKLIKIMFDK